MSIKSVRLGFFFEGVTVTFLDSLIWHPAYTGSGTCWEVLPEMKLYIVCWLPKWRNELQGMGLLMILRHPLRQQAFWRQTWLMVHGISINCSQTSVWGLGKVWKRFSGKSLIQKSTDCFLCGKWHASVLWNSGNWKRVPVSRLMESPCRPSHRLCFLLWCLALQWSHCA